MTRDPVATLVDIIINLNDQLRVAAMEIERLKQAQAAPLRAVPPVEEKEDG